MTISKVNIATIILILGAVLTSLITIERIRLGARPGLGLVVFGLLIPLTIISYYFHHQHILENFKIYLKRRAEFHIVKIFMMVFAYLGVLFTISYSLYTNPTFIIGWFLAATPFASYALLKFFKKYL